MSRGTQQDRAARSGGSLRPLIGLVAVGGMLVALAPGTAQAAETAPAVAPQRLVQPVASRTATATVHFASGKSVVTPYSQRILTRLVRSLPAGAVVQSTKIVGYVQAKTAWDNGRALGTARATAVKSRLQALGLTGRFALSSGGIYGTTDLSRRAVVTITYVVPASQTIQFAQPDAMTVGDDDQLLSAFATSGLRVTVRSTSTSVCTVVGTADAPAVHAVSAGDCGLVATQPGSTVYRAASSVSRTVTVDPVHVDPPAPATYDLSFYAQGGTVDPTTTLWTEGDDPILLPTPTRDGFTFAGWYDAADGGSLVGAAGDEWTPDHDAGLYAHWTEVVAPEPTPSPTQSQAVSYDIAYDAQSGTVSPTSATWTEGDEALVLPTPSRDGFTFDGWYDAADGGSLVGAAGDEWTPDHDGTLYAHWTAVPVAHVVTFHSNYYQGPASTTQSSEDAAALTANPFAGPGDGRVFAGWASEAGGAVVYTDGARYGFASSTDLYAVWGYAVRLNHESYYQGNDDLWYCGRADGDCTADNLTHVVLDANTGTYDFVVFPNENTDDNVLGGFEVAFSSDGWEVYLSGSATFDPAMNAQGVNWWSGPAQVVHLDVTGNVTIYDGIA